MKTVIFDLDGTLADTSGDLIAAANSCFERRGLGPLLDKQADKLTAFHGGRAMLRLGFSRSEQRLGEDAIDEDYPYLLEKYGQNIDVDTFLYPGAVNSIKELRRDGFALGICTNKPEVLAERLMQRLNVRHLFQSLIGADTLPTRKPEVAPYSASVERAGGKVGNSLLIGDTETDVKTARAAGVPVVLVGFGPEGEAVKRLGPDALLRSYEDLPGVVRHLLG